MLNAKQSIIYNLQETRRRSIKLWRALPNESLDWKPDPDAMSFGEMIRHVWVGTIEYHQLLVRGGSAVPGLMLDETAEKEPINSVEDEIALSEPHFERFISYIEGLSDSVIAEAVIDRSDVGYKRTLGDMLLRIAYHDAVHTGQFLQYMRMAGIERPNIWD